jgi:hypothetical protein
MCSGVPKTTMGLAVLGMRVYAVRTPKGDGMSGLRYMYTAKGDADMRARSSATRA